ncbi:MAG TPA: di-heme oxidoredictase family protein [Gemmataceae bacterium]|nr:di-heme oxidoredictase family protein [Gemmataceae bacterium]
MNKSYRAWYVLAALLALVPAGARMLLWQRARPQVVDRDMAQAGETLFKHVWQEQDPLSPGGDGLGPVFNATSCVACHHQAGPGGGGGLEHNVTTFTVRDGLGAAPREGVVHGYGLGCQETLKDIHPDLPAVSRPSLDQLVVLQGRGNHCLKFPRGVHLSQRNTPALFGANLIDALPERVILAGAKAQRLKAGMAPADDEDLSVGRAPRLADGRIGRFGWKAQTASLSDFVQAACANELGLGNPGHSQPRPLGKSTIQATGLDLTQQQCDQLTAFVAALPRPEERLPDSAAAQVTAAAGKRLFGSLGCADCHTPDLGSVEGIYSDLLLHRMGQELVGGGSYGEPPLPGPDGSPGEGPTPSEWRTPPLWGVADSAPYLHDGRAATLEEAIRLHGGQGQRAAERFEKLSTSEQAQLVTFLKTLRAP